MYQLNFPTVICPRTAKKMYRLNKAFNEKVPQLLQEKCTCFIFLPSVGGNRKKTHLYDLIFCQNDKVGL
jgi:hypothetical protein